MVKGIAHVDCEPFKLGMIRESGIVLENTMWRAGWGEGGEIRKLRACKMVEHSVTCIAVKAVPESGL